MPLIVPIRIENMVVKYKVWYMPTDRHGFHEGCKTIPSWQTQLSRNIWPPKADLKLGPKEEEDTRSPSEVTVTNPSWFANSSIQPKNYIDVLTWCYPFWCLLLIHPTDKESKGTYTTVCYPNLTQIIWHVIQTHHWYEQATVHRPWLTVYVQWPM